MEEKIEESRQKIDQLIQELEKAVIGKRSTIQLMIVALTRFLPPPLGTLDQYVDITARGNVEE